jgi:hypothetical protein
MSATYDPVYASMKTGKTDIADINNTCYSVCSAFEGVTSPWEINEKCSEKCGKAIEKLRVNDFSATSCAHPAPLRPVIWNQSPAFFPKEYEKTGDIQKALERCQELCNNTKYPKQCMQDAIIQSYAVECNHGVMSIKREDYNDDNESDKMHNEKKERGSSSINLKKIILILSICLFVGILLRILAKYGKEWLPKF